MEFIAEHYPTLLVMLGLLACSGFYSSSETALFSLSREQLRDLESTGGTTDAAILNLVRDPSNLLVTILLGNMVVNVLFFCMSAVVAGRLGPGHWVEVHVFRSEPRRGEAPRLRGYRGRLLVE